jgi:hypothetical protein
VIGPSVVADEANRRPFGHEMVTKADKRTSRTFRTEPPGSGLPGNCKRVFSCGDEMRDP